LSNGEDGEGRRGRNGSAARTGRADLRRAAAEKRIELAPLRRRVADAEKAVTRLTAEIARLDATLVDLFARDPSKAAALAKARAEHADALAAAEEDWLAASAELEASSGP
jgi:ATP-binding cassette subfamily F protein 3